MGSVLYIIRLNNQSQNSNVKSQNHNLKPLIFYADINLYHTKSYLLVLSVENCNTDSISLVPVGFMALGFGFEL